MLSRFRPILFAFLALAAVVVAAQGIPQQANQYRGEVTRQAKFYWGANAPIATFCGQIHQESAWRSNAKSKYAAGLTQFTPDTEKWIAGAYSKELGGGSVMNPAWAIRALMIYDLHLWNRIKDTGSSCDRMAMTLAAYNGGPGWINRDRELATARGADARLWFHHVELYSKRAKWAFEENRHYPRAILLKHQRLYVPWGPGVACRAV